MTNYIAHGCKKVKEVGIKNTVKGLVRRKKLGKVCKSYGLDTWHKSPYELRLYAQMAADSVNELEGHCVVEVGCGLGEILRHIKAPKKYGYDIDSHVIEAAQAITAKGAPIKYFVGGLEEIDVPDADCLVTISWMHGMPEEYLKEAYRIALERNNFRYIVVDVKIIENRQRDFSHILPSCYECISRKKYKAVESEIWVEVWECMTEK